MFLDTKREKTRRERYDEKLKVATEIPLIIATVNFSFDENLAFLIRSAACFGVRDIFVIGSLPDRSYLNPRSGSLYDYIRFKTFPNPMRFTEFCVKNGYKQVAVELNEGAENIYEYSFDFSQKTVLIVGNEETGVPAEISLKNESIFIPMNGPGYCLNVSHAGTVAMSEYCRQYFNK